MLIDKSEIQEKGHLCQNQIEILKNWIPNFFEMSGRLYKGKTSYCFKHEAEKDLRIYISNSSFIEAMRSLGYEGKPCTPNDKNFYFMVKPRLRYYLTFYYSKTDEDFIPNEFRRTVVGIRENALDVFETLKKRGDLKNEYYLFS